MDNDRSVYFFVHRSTLLPLFWTKLCQFFFFSYKYNTTAKHNRIAKIENSNSQLFEHLRVAYLLWIYPCSRLTRTHRYPHARFYKDYSLSSSCNRVGGAFQARRGRRVEAYTRIPGKLIQDQSRNNHRRRTHFPSLSLSLSLSSIKGSLARGEER